ncbi:hypothetical protein [Streptomyces sp. NPDC001787]|uniref:hypothetical protein n=1 Tax=Streptomyces sp. NPDC001787 TaxID=3154523 RepID=UPI0033302FE9
MENCEESEHNPLSADREAEEIVFDKKLSGIAKRERIFALLSQKPDHGVAAAVDFLLKTQDANTATYLAQYLELIPGAWEAKTRAAERLRVEEGLAEAVTWLVAWLPGTLLDGLISDFVSQADQDSPLIDVLFNIGVYAPERLRPYADRIENEDVQRSLLSGAPDELADAFAEKWRTEGDLSLLEALALIRTEYAVELVLSARESVDEHSEWEMLCQLAGHLPDTGREAGHRPAHMGFITGQGMGNNIVGGRVEGDVPLCLECASPAERLLRVSAADSPFDLKNDASFFWYSCGCEALDSTTVRISEDGQTVLKVYYGPKGPAGKAVRLVPGGEQSLTLEVHRNQTGVSVEAVPGESLHQVGGLPRWVETEQHPRCPECHDAMPFLASVSSGPTLFGNMGFEGILYGFWCDGCRVSSTKFQS